MKLSIPWRDVAYGALALLVPTTLVAIATAALFADATREALPPLAQHGGDLHDARWILLNNARIALGMCVVAYLLSSWWYSERASLRLVSRLLAGYVLAVVIASAWTIGRAVGAYPHEILTGVLGHAVLEVAAFGIAIGLVLRATRPPALSAGDIAATGLLAAALLVPAALLEVYA